MLTTKRALFYLFVLCIAIFASAQKQSSVVAGHYEGTANSAQGQDIPFTIDLSETAGTFSGQINSSQGDFTIVGGTRTGDSITIEFDLGGERGVITAKVADGRLVGTYNAGNDTGTFDAKKTTVTSVPPPPTAPSAPWSEKKANDWYAAQSWLVGSNYIPKDAINELEMWQEATFNPAEIDKELGWAEAMGMNTMRVFLHDLLWQQDAAGFRERLDQFLTIAARHHIRPLFVLFDSVWDPLPQLGPQHPPIPGVHNSGWVQSPGAKALADAAQMPRLKAYVQGVIGAFAKDDRVLAWDVWNEPSNTNGGSYSKTELKPAEKRARVAQLLPQVFAWAREMNPIQPLTSGVWDIDFSRDESALNEIARIQLRESDVITFHNYDWPESFKAEITWLRRFRRPVICSEYMARAVGSTFDTILPIAKQEHVGAINWGFVAGKTQTYLPWESWEHPYVLSQPPVWFHEVLHPDGTPYRQAEVDLIRELTGKR